VIGARVKDDESSAGMIDRMIARARALDDYIISSDGMREEERIRKAKVHFQNE